MGEAEIAIGLAAISSLAGATAAIASWRSIKLSRAPRPVVTPELVNGELSKVTVANAGLGPALRVYLCLVLEGERFVAAGTESNVIASDGSFPVRPKFSHPVKLLPSDPSRLRGFVACFDVYGRPVARTLGDEPIKGLAKWRGFRRVARKVDEYQILGKLYGAEFGEQVKEMPRVENAG